MVKCKCCGAELGNIVKFDNLGIEVDFNQEQNEKKFKQIKIRKGWRLLKLKELDEVMNYIIENNLDIWSYFEQPIKSYKNKYIARFLADSGGADLCCDWDPGFSLSGLGVIFCRAVKDGK
jgi:hypothetical protein